MGNLCSKESVPSAYLNRGDPIHTSEDRFPVGQRSRTRILTPCPLEATEVDNRLQSAFLGRLSLDVRMLIYEEVLEIGGALHIELQLDKLVYIKCLRPGAISDANSFTRDSWGRHHQVCKASVVNAIITCTRNNPFFPLLVTCRQVYFEVVPVIYSLHTFSFIGIAAASRFFSTVSREHLASIQRLELLWLINKPLYSTPPNSSKAPTDLLAHPLDPHVDEAKWEQLWLAIAKMPLLQTIRVTLYDPKNEVPGSTLLEPLRTVRAQHFEVQLPWLKDSATATDFEGAPFRIIRPSPRPKFAPI